MAFIPSNKIYIYPAYNRNSGINPESKLGTEFNLTSALANLVTQNGGSFVVSYSSPNIVMCIHGYLIQADLTGIVTDSGDWYAHLVYSNKGGSTYTNLLELTPSGGGTNLDNEDDGNFKGLVIDNSAEYSGNSYTLKILSSGKVPEESYHKFNLNQLHSYVNSNYVIRKNSDLYLETEDVAHHNDYHPLEDDETFYALVYGDLYSRYYYKDLTTQSPSASGTTTSFIDTISQASDGKIIATKKSFTLEATATQGQLSLNGTAINIKDLQTTSSPTFTGLTLSGGATINGSVTLRSSLNSYSFINSNSNKLEIEYDEGNAIYLSASADVDFSDDGEYNVINIGEKGYLKFNGNPIIEGNSTNLTLNNNLVVQQGTTKGTTTLAAGSYSSVSTTGSESITVAGNSFNVATRDTTQTIGGKKTFNYTNRDDQDDPAVVVEGKAKFNSVNSYNVPTTLLTLDGNKLLSKFTKTVGSTTEPIYLSNGIPNTASKYAGGTKVTLNGTNKGANTATFYAPTTGGTNGQFLQSNGSGEPSWQGLYEHRFTVAYKNATSEYPLRSVVRFVIITTKSTKYINSASSANDVSSLSYELTSLGYAGNNQPLPSSGAWYTYVSNVWKTNIISGINPIYENGVYKLQLQYAHQTDNMCITLVDGDAFVSEDIRQIK